MGNALWGLVGLRVLWVFLGVLSYLAFVGAAVSARGSGGDTGYILMVLELIALFTVVPASVSSRLSGRKLLGFGVTGLLMGLMSLMLLYMFLSDVDLSVRPGSESAYLALLAFLLFAGISGLLMFMKYLYRLALLACILSFLC